MLIVPLKKGEAEVEATWRFATWADVGVLQGWTEYLGPDSSGNMRDSTDFARQAVLRWQSYADIGRSAESLAAAARKRLDRQELVALMVLTASWWFRPEEPLAFAYFRRTWCGGLYLEFMAGHPLAEGQVSGLLRATISCLAMVAVATGCEWVWWEATEESFPKYQKVVGNKNILERFIPPVQDLFVVRVSELQSLQK